MPANTTNYKLLDEQLVDFPVSKIIPNSQKKQNLLLNYFGKLFTNLAVKQNLPANATNYKSLDEQLAQLTS